MNNSQGDSSAAPQNDKTGNSARNSQGDSSDFANPAVSQPLSEQNGGVGNSAKSTPLKNQPDIVNQINFSALNDKTISRKSFTAEQLATASFGRYDVGKILFTVLDVIFGVWFLVGLILAIIGGATVGPGGALFIIGLGNVVFAAIFLAIFLPVTFFIGRDRYRILKFVLDNGWRAGFSASRSASAEALLFQQGHSRIMTFWLQNPRENWLFANYQYTTGSGKNSTTHHFDFAQIALPRKVPHLIINSRKNFFGAPTFGYDVKKVQVEGNFNDFFTIITPPEYERDALQILTPDVLRVLMDFGTAFDFEMLDDKLFIFAQNATLAKADKFRELIMAISRVSPKISHQVKTYSDEKIAQLKVGENGEVTAASAQNLIAKKGTRLKPKWWVAAVSVAATIFWIILQIVSSILRGNN